MDAINALQAIVAQLRATGGCDWDRAQTLRSLRPYLLEETYEVLHAIDRNDSAELLAELGDLLHQLVLLCQIASEHQQFDLSQVAAQATQKCIRRHPQVFGPTRDVPSWEARKAAEHPTHRSALDGLPAAMPSLLRAHRVAEKASGVGFDWTALAQVRHQLDLELAELDQALEQGDPKAIEHEYGDVLLTVANMGRFLGRCAEDALRQATARFEARFRHLENALHQAGKSVHACSAAELDEAWQRAKQAVQTT